MAMVEKSAEILKAQARLWNQLFCFKNSASLKCAVQLGIPDAIDSHGKAMTLSELSLALPINPSKACYIHRLMRILLNAGFFVEERLEDANDEEDKAYALAPPGHLLVKNNPLNLREFVLFELDPVLLKPWNSLSEWFQNDDPTAFETAHGKKLWDYTSEEPKFCKQFNEGMVSDSKLISELLISEYKFVFEGLHSMVDVGGGTGTVSKAIARMFPSLKCTVYDLPHVVADLEGTENLDFVAGDMFEKVPSANAILLKWVLHNWNDEDCVKILKNCKKAIPGKEKGGKVIIIESVMESQIQDSESVEAVMCMDMQMLVQLNAKQRTEKDWVTLFREAGLGEHNLFPMLGTTRCIIEVYP